MSEAIREIVLDTETTGLSPEEGHRIIEIGALELINHMPTGNKLHLYIQPERDIDEAAEKVHGISSAFLADKPVFKDIADEFLDFIKDDVMIIHNAPFDMGFINAELKRLGHAALPASRALDTLPMARKKFPGAQASLDALCRRFEIDNSHRDLHGALIDADLLAEVYIELIGGRQPDLMLSGSQANGITSPSPYPQSAQNPSSQANSTDGFSLSDNVANRPIRPARPHHASPEELARHEAFLEKIENPIWKQS